MNRVAVMMCIMVLVIAFACAPYAGQILNYPVPTSLATKAVIFAIAASALNLVLGDAGLVSFGHAAYFGLGGYVVGILNLHYVSNTKFLTLIAGTNDLVATLLVAIILGGALGLFFGAVALRTRGAQFIIITLALSQMMFYLFVSLRMYGGDDGIGVRRRNVLPVIDTSSDATFYYVCLFILIVVVGTLEHLRRSRFGFIVSAIRQSERRVGAAGLVPFRFQLLAMTISGAIASLAGALMANQLKFVSPEMLSWEQSGDLMIMVILGGVGTTLGPFLGAAAFVALEHIFSVWTNNGQIGVGMVLLCVVMFTKGGLQSAVDRLLARRAS